MKTDPLAHDLRDSPLEAGQSSGRSRKLLRIAALIVLLGAVGGWIASGARVGWTQTSITELKTDEITGIEYPVRQPAFVPGLEVPVAGVLLAAGLAGLSLLARRARRAA
jgi:hypothetical protein